MLAAPYRPLSAVPVVPAFEIIATVAEGLPRAGWGLLVRNAHSVAAPLGQAWDRREMYVILDLQAGRASLLAQAKAYQPLLRLPDVGLAIDPEWTLQPHQLPLRQIGSVSIRQVDGRDPGGSPPSPPGTGCPEAVCWHQFMLSMISNEQRLDTGYGDLAIVIHMDGQGTPEDKDQTWDAVTSAAPPGVFFGWKNFFVKDHPMMNPQQTMARTPLPVMISYQ